MPRAPDVPRPTCLGRSPMTGSQTPPTAAMPNTLLSRLTTGLCQHFVEADHRRLKATLRPGTDSNARRHRARSPRRHYAVTGDTPVEFPSRSTTSLSL